MQVQALGYVGIGASDLTDWTDFATNWLGMQMVERGNACRAFRMDDRSQRLVVDRSLADGERYFGFEVADAAALDALAARLEAHGVPVRREPAALADQRCVRGLISFADPGGNRLEAFWGAAVADEPFRPGRSISGFRTGPLGMGHAVFHVKNIDDLLGFYRDVLGFGVSDYILTPFRAYFLHVNPRHHTRGADRDRQAGPASPDGGAVFAGRCGAGLRHRVGRAGPDRHHAGAASERLRDVVLPEVAVRLHAGIRLGRQGRDAREVAGDGSDRRPEPVGSRPHLAAG